MFCYFGSQYDRIVGTTHFNSSVILHENMDCAFGQRNRSIVSSSGDVGRCERSEEEEGDANNKDAKYRGNTRLHRS